MAEKTRKLVLAIFKDLAYLLSPIRIPQADRNKKPKKQRINKFFSELSFKVLME